jgi:hypothetical protein
VIGYALVKLCVFAKAQQEQQRQIAGEDDDAANGGDQFAADLRRLDRFGLQRLALAGPFTPPQPQRKECAGDRCIIDRGLLEAVEYSVQQHGVFRCWKTPSYGRLAPAVLMK